MYKRQLEVRSLNNRYLKAANLRTRVRSYFSSDRRRKVAQLLRETVRIDHTVCDGPMEAEVLEVRLIAEWTPRFNKVGTRSAGYTYLKLSLIHI